MSREHKNWKLLAKHPHLWKGWRDLGTHYGATRQEAVEWAQKMHRCFEGVKIYKLVEA